MRFLLLDRFALADRAFAAASDAFDLRTLIDTLLSIVSMCDA